MFRWGELKRPIIVLYLTFCVQTAQARPGVAVCAPLAHRPRGDSTHTHPKQPPVRSREYCGAAVGISKRFSPAAKAFAGAEACGRRAPAFWLPQSRQCGATRGLPARPALGSARPRSDIPRLLRNLINPTGKTARQHPEIRKKNMAPVEAAESGLVSLPAGLVSKSAKGALLGESLL